tara:strand:- start:921 stop:1874 length:954 start_codon:yes stop_codon:yes gene_type:complete
MNKMSESTPFTDIRFFKQNKFNIRIILINHRDQISKEKTAETDEFGHINLKISNNTQLEKIKTIKIYENSFRKGIDFFLGSFSPENLNAEKKVLITDFDKTLVDTKYSTIKEIFKSLTSPVSDFPNIDTSLEKVEKYIKDGHQPFILSSSPHFYENTIKEWLKKNHLEIKNIFLKDYRQFFSLSPTDLIFKDVKAHGVHKLAQLLNIILMTDLPREIILIGDNSESDPVIYSITKYILSNHFNPDEIWGLIRDLNSFKLNNTQSLKILNRLYLLKNLIDQKGRNTEVKIYIRKVPGVSSKSLPPFLSKTMNQIEFYD